MKLSRHIYIIATAATMIATGCTCSSGGSDEDLSKVSPEISAAAIAAADSVIGAGSDENAIGERLLDVRATIYAISRDRSQRDAEDFERVFKAHIRTHNDSLAKIIF